MTAPNSAFLGFAFDAITAGTPQFGELQKGQPHNWVTVAVLPTPAAAVARAAQHRAAIGGVGSVDVLGSAIDAFVADAVNEYETSAQGTRVVTTWTIVLDPFVAVNPVPP